MFSNAPHLDDMDMLPPIEYPVRVAEELLRVPLKTTDIVMMIVESDEWTGSFKTDTHVQLSVGRGGLHGLSGGNDVLHHEMAHYYFTGTMRWMNEGGAELIEDLAGYPGEIGGSSPSGRGAERRAQDCMEAYGFENIRHLHHTRSNNRTEWNIHEPYGCYYSMGLNFLHRAYDTIGGEALSAALGEIVSSGDIDASDEEQERAIYDAFMKHTPENRKEAFKDLYRALHGGPYAYDESAATDDHGDAADDATQVEVGEVVRGSLDYMFDFDYFRFEAQEGRKYRFSVAHKSLGASSVGLFSGPDGIRGENQNWESRELGASGPEIVWVAPSSDEYYLAVQNFGGKTGIYTLTINEAQSD